MAPTIARQGKLLLRIYPGEFFRADYGVLVNTSRPT